MYDGLSQSIQFRGLVILEVLAFETNIAAPHPCVPSPGVEGHVKHKIVSHPRDSLFLVTPSTEQPCQVAIVCVHVNLPAFLILVGFGDTRLIPAELRPLILGDWNWLRRLYLRPSTVARSRRLLGQFQAEPNVGTEGLVIRREEKHTQGSFDARFGGSRRPQSETRAPAMEVRPALKSQQTLRLGCHRELRMDVTGEISIWRVALQGNESMTVQSYRNGELRACYPNESR